MVSSLHSIFNASALNFNHEPWLLTLWKALISFSKDALPRISCPSMWIRYDIALVCWNWDKKGDVGTSKIVRLGNSLHENGKNILWFIDGLISWKTFSVFEWVSVLDVSSHLFPIFHSKALLNYFCIISVWRVSQRWVYFLWKGISLVYI